MRRLAASTLTLVFFYFCGFARGQNPTPDLILFNGEICTSNGARPCVEPLAIRGERIIATGESVKIKSLADPQTNKLILPATQ